jgi:hypothetical protein
MPQAGHVVALVGSAIPLSWPHLGQILYMISEAPRWQIYFSHRLPSVGYPEGINKPDTSFTASFEI